MSRKTLQTLTAAIAVILAMIIAWAVLAENFIVPVVAILLAVGINFILRRSTREVVQDERTGRLYEKASGMTIKIMLPVLALISIILYLSRNSLPGGADSVAFTLAYVTCAFLLIHSTFYTYYDRKN